MMKKTLTASLAAPVLLLGGVCAQEQTPPTAPAPAAEAENAIPPLKQDPQLHSGVLENGLHYLIRRTKAPVGQGSMMLYVNVGSLDETEETRGVSHFIEHMVFNGSRSFKRGELMAAMQKRGLGIGGDANAFTAFDNTTFMLDLPRLDDETVGFAMNVLREFADGATLADDAVEHERGIVISEMKRGDSEQLRTQLAIMRAFTPGTRIADSQPIGLEKVIRNIPAESVREYYRSHYVPANMTVIITGDIDVEKMEGLVRSHFADMEAREPVPRAPLKLDFSQRVDELVLPHSEQALLSISLAVVKPDSQRPDSIERRADELPLDLALAMLNNRFSRLCRLQDSPILGIKILKNSLMKTSEIFSLNLNVAPEKWQVGLAMAERELRNAIEYGFSEQEIKEVTGAILGGFSQAVVAWESTTARQMADKLQESLSEGLVPTDAAEARRSLLVGLKRIAADPDLCRRALAQEYMSGPWDSASCGERVKLVASGAIPADLTEQSLRAAFNEAHALPTVRPEPPKVESFAYDVVGEPGKVVDQSRLDDLDVTCLTLSNGVRVNLKHTKSQRGTVRMVAAVDGGTLNMPFIPGLDMVASAMIQAGGLEAHSSDDLERIFAGHRVGVAFGQKPGRFTFTSETSSKDVELQCKILAASIMHPSYRSDGEQQLQRRMPAFLQRMVTSPNGAFEMKASHILYKSDPRFTVPTAEQVAALSTERVRAIVEPFLREGAMEFTIVGDYDKESIIPILERTIGAMPPRHKEFTPIPEENRTVNLLRQDGVFRLPYPSNVDRTLVTQVRFAGDGRDQRRNMAITVLASIVQEKLFAELRTKLGEAYAPQVSYTPNEEMKDAAFISTISSGVIANQEIVDAAMTTVCEDLGKGNISDDDFARAHRPFMSSLSKSMRSNSYWLNNLSDIQSNPERATLMRHRLAYLRAVTVDEVRALAKEIFGSGPVLHFFTVPETTPKS